MIIEGKIEN